MSTPRVGRFAPSPTGPLHLGSLVAAMASWLDVRAHGGRWLVRVEDIDQPREVAGAADDIVATLAALGFRWHGPIVRQSERLSLYQRAFDRLKEMGRVYPCGCTRIEVEQAASAPDQGSVHAIYPGTCRHGLPAGRTPRSWRMRVTDDDIRFNDRAAGPTTQNLAREVGDFVIKRADGLWAYQLAVVVDDADQGVTDVVRGADLLESTGRQRLLQEVLGLPQPRTLHVPLVFGADGHKLSKSNDVEPIDRSRALLALRAAARHLALGIGDATTIDRFWSDATRAWAARWPID
jgi:glutamyl-Q tRNA(Asp) synthetase